MELRPWTRPLTGRITPPGDKSVTHRAILFSLLTRHVMEIDGWLDAADTRSSLRFAEALGGRVREMTAGRLVLEGPGLPALKEPGAPVDCGNSGTTMRLASGISAGIPGLVILVGDSSLSSRPMGRVLEPLQALGVRTLARCGNLAPLAIQGGAHKGGEVRLSVASAQVKSAMLLAGLTASDRLTVVEPMPTRDHTERMLRAMGAAVDSGPHHVAIDPEPVLQGMVVKVPGDPSSAAFWAALAVLCPGSDITLENISLNPGRTGFFHTLQQMGAQIEIRVETEIPEPLGTVRIRSGKTHGIEVTADMVPAMVDEIPLLALVAALSSGVTRIRGASELRVKESDRIQATAEGLSLMGAHVMTEEDGFVIEGVPALKGARVQAYGDHRIAMMWAVAAAVAEGPLDLVGAESVAISYPDFFAQYRNFRGAE